ncbi:DinB family protein [Alkalicoccus luteus]|uniref:DinB family protein n=1 Tax=Alkalicoccus luteus TaxID=1237094 RepID=A0A969PV87_9BACI|nr:DinB family protein [Alkalicoccus luteus]NJP38134.1 DinB family protein [Alkalicoccus luteus]
MAEWKMEAIIPFAGMLEEQNETWLNTPTAPAKWGTREIIGHLFYWDRFLLESVLPAMQAGKPIPPFPIPDVYNRSAVAALEGRSAHRLIRDFIETRQALVAVLKETAPESVPQKGSDKTWTPAELDAFFGAHDEHHQLQIETFLHDRNQAYRRS